MDSEVKQAEFLGMDSETKQAGILKAVREADKFGSDAPINQHISRQQKRLAEREQLKQQEAFRRQMNAPALKKDLVQTHMYLKSLADRIYHLDVLIAAIERTVLDKGLITKDELKKAYIFEAERATTFEEIQNSKEDTPYEELLEKCKKYEIDPNPTIITERLAHDEKVPEEEKLRLAEKYSIVRILNPEERSEIPKPRVEMVKMKR